MMFFYNIREILIFNQVKENGEEYIPLGRRQAIDRMDQG